MWEQFLDPQLTFVHMNADVFMVCLEHALSTDKEEIMGLFIGEINNKQAFISALVMLRRSDKRKDRVEISPEQLGGAADHAENLAKQTGKPMRVIGWYHSHPHITVWPSHVDVRTQFSYQMLDKGFVGIIFSVFSEDKNTKEQEIQITCFQSAGEASDLQRRDVPLRVVPQPTLSKLCLESIIRFPEILMEEEIDTYNKASLAVNNILGRIRNSAEMTKTTCSITELISLPMLLMLDNHTTSGQHSISRLAKEKEMLEQMLSKM